jgi:hypothetical protein
VAEASWPSPDHNSRNVTEAEYEVIGARATDDGIDGDPTGPAVVTAGSGLQVLVKAGRTGVVRGFAWSSGSSDVPLAISANSSGQTRYDAVVLQLDRSSWNVRAVVKEGTPGAAAPPPLTRDAGDTGEWEIVLAYVGIPSGASSVTVEDRPQYIGSRVRPADNGKVPPNPAVGEILFQPNAGRWRGWTGVQYVSLYENSGEVIVSGWTTTWSANSDSVAQLRNGWVSIRISVRRQVSVFSPNDSDGGSRILTLPTGFAPGRWQYFEGRFSNGAYTTVQVRSDGEVWATAPSQDVAPGRNLNLTVNYPL